MRKNQFNDLRTRAQKILQKSSEKKSIFGQEISELIDELMLHQIELEIQNEDLIKSQTDLEESRSKYVELYDLAPLGYFSFNPEGLIKEVNQAGCKLLGLRKVALINRCFSRYVAPEHQTLYSQYRKQAFKEKKLQSFELKLMRWNQPSFYASLEAKVIENEETGTYQLLTFVTDSSQRKQAEDTLHLQRIKMASIDRLRSITELVYGMAQEQNNALMIMDNYLQGCIRRLETKNYKPEELLQALKIVSNNSRVVTDIILSRKIITTKSIFHYVSANINTLIKQTISLLTHEMFDFPVIVQYTESDMHLKIKLDIYHIQQAILNLARNAIEAMRDNKTLEPKLLIEISESRQNTIEVNMFDNGPGLIKDYIPKLFEPHFTTKSYSIGLGLTVSRAIIEKHGGELFAIPNPSGGACFGFTLPCLPN